MSAYITKNEIEAIALTLTQPKKAKLDTARAEAEQTCQDIVLGFFPKEVRDFAGRYPDMIREQRVVCTPDTDRRVLYVKTPVFEHFGVQGAVDDLRQLPTSALREKLDDLTKYQKDYRDTHNKVLCVLKAIRTVRKLKSEFPEAHQELIKLRGANAMPTVCDDVERLRAELK